MYALHEPVAGELLEVAVDGHGGDRVVAHEVGDRDAAVALDPLQHLGPAQRGRHGVHPPPPASAR